MRSDILENQLRNNRALDVGSKVFTTDLTPCIKAVEKAINNLE